VFSLSSGTRLAEMPLSFVWRRAQPHPNKEHTIDRKGHLPGGIISEVKNILSGKLYLLSTAPEIGQDYWSTSVFPMAQRKALFGLIKSNVPDVYNPIASFTRNSMADAHVVHAQVRHVVTSVREDNWLASFPSPAPPDGYSDGARNKLKNHLGYDPV
jgi:hypothetical protein